MSRRRAAEKREVLPDAKFGDKVLTKFMNNLMLDGKKSVAERIVYGALDRVENKVKRAPVELFHEALDNIKPTVEVRSRRVGGATYQVPMEVAPDRQMSLGVRWIVGFAKKRKGIRAADALATEILDAYQGQGSAIRRRDEVHKMAQANKAFAHFRW